MSYTGPTGFRETGEPFAASLGEFHGGPSGSADTYLGDAVPAYTQWVSAVKKNGGTVTAWPWPQQDGSFPVLPAARYPVATYVDLFNHGVIKASEVQRAANDNKSVYVLGGSYVIEAAKQLTKVRPDEAARLPGGESGWNPFANVSTTTKVVAGAAAVTAVAAVLGLFRRHG